MPYRLYIAMDFKTRIGGIAQIPTSALDIESESQVQNSIDAVRGDKTIILIAHRLSTAKNCDTIFVLKDGRIVEQGAYNYLYNLHGEFTHMVSRQALVSATQKNGHEGYATIDADSK